MVIRAVCPSCNGSYEVKSLCDDSDFYEFAYCPFCGEESNEDIEEIEEYG